MFYILFYIICIVFVKICSVVFVFSTGRIDYAEIQQAFKELGMNIPKEKAEKILQR